MVAKLVTLASMGVSSTEIDIHYTAVQARTQYERLQSARPGATIFWRQQQRLVVLCEHLHPDVFPLLDREMRS
jgi:hypothetical protein